MTDSQKSIAWAVSRIEEEIKKAEDSQARARLRLNRLTAAGKAQNQKAIKRATDLISRRRGEVIGLGKALAFVRQAQKAGA